MPQHTAAAPSTAWFRPRCGTSANARPARSRRPRRPYVPSRSLRRASACRRACPGSNVSSGGSGGSSRSASTTTLPDRSTWPTWKSGCGVSSDAPPRASDLRFLVRGQPVRERTPCRADPRGSGARDTGTSPRVRRRGRLTRPSSSRPARVGHLIGTPQRGAVVPVTYRCARCRIAAARRRLGTRPPRSWPSTTPCGSAASGAGTSAS